jgi:hypothetical protein
MLNKVVVAACALFVALNAWAAVGPGGLGLPLAAQALTALTMLVLLLGHMWKHLGTGLMIAFFATGAVVEWLFEQTNISYGGFIWGDLRYGDIGVFNLHVGDVPLAVPLMMAAILWPTYAMVNVVLDGTIVVDPRTMKWWQTVWRCGLYGLVHSWLMLVCNAECEKFGLYHWVGRTLRYSPADMFLGDPTAPRGWAIYVFVTMLVFAFAMVPLLGKTALQHARLRRLDWADGAPIVLMGVIGVQVYLNPVNLTVGNIALWTLGFFAALVGYRFVALMRVPRATVTDQGHARVESEGVATT